MVEHLPVACKAGLVPPATVQMYDSMSPAVTLICLCVVVVIIVTLLPNYCLQGISSQLLGNQHATV
jgi:heme/copper-type cytochrome/quinol oxidase subunit 2